MDRSSTKSERPKTRAGPATGNETGLIGNGHSHPCRHVPVGVKALDACCRPWRESGHVRRFPWPGERREEIDSLRKGHRIEPDATNAADAGVGFRAVPGTDGDGLDMGVSLRSRALRLARRQRRQPLRQERRDVLCLSRREIASRPVKAYCPKRLATRTDCERALSPGSGALGLPNEQ